MTSSTYVVRALPPFDDISRRDVSTTLGAPGAQPLALGHDPICIRLAGEHGPAFAIGHADGISALACPFGHLNDVAEVDFIAIICPHAYYGLFAAHGELPPDPGTCSVIAAHRNRASVVLSPVELAHSILVKVPPVAEYIWFLLRAEFAGDVHP